MTKLAAFVIVFLLYAMCVIGIVKLWKNVFNDEDNKPKGGAE